MSLPSYSPGPPPATAPSPRSEDATNRARIWGVKHWYLVPQVVPGSPRPRCAGEGRVDPGPLGRPALGPSFYIGRNPARLFG